MDAPILAKALWSAGSGPNCPQAYALLDGARDDLIVPAMRLSNLPTTCLYAGSLSRSLETAAPHLVQLAPESRFFAQLAATGWGKAWGIFIVARPDVTLKALRRHFRSLLIARGPAGERWMFRYYDPRVLRDYLPTCDDASKFRFMGPINSLFCESDADADDIVPFHRPEVGHVEADLGDIPSISNDQLRVFEDTKLVQMGMAHLECHLPQAAGQLTSDCVRGWVRKARAAGMTDAITILRYVALAALSKVRRDDMAICRFDETLQDISLGSADERMKHLLKRVLSAYSSPALES